MKANDRQVGGDHYKGDAIEHWDVVWQHDLDYFQGQITKYVMRWRDKGGMDDLLKAQHFLEKYIELVKTDMTAGLDAERPICSALGIEIIRCDDGFDALGNQCILPKYHEDAHKYNSNNDPAPNKADSMETKPTGWVKFSYEGTDDKGALFTCRGCRTEVRCPHGYFPGFYHSCNAFGSEPDKRYVDQD